jgi:hypothetical protein
MAQSRQSGEYVKPKHFGKIEIHSNTRPDEVYLRRWYLFRCKWFSIRLHHILLPDEDRDPHDHPWWFLTIILRGGYTERWMRYFRPRESIHQFPHWRWGRFSIKHVRRFSFHKPNDIHQIIEFNRPQGSWTLFITGAERQEWGFMTERGWVHWSEYIGAKP